VLSTRRRTLLILATALGIALPQAYADDADLLAKLRACAAEPDDLHRLACYDKQLRPGATAPSQPKTATDPAPVDAATAEQRFGMNGQVARNNPAGQPPNLEKLTGRVAAIWYRPRGEAVFKLENGQMWEEAEGETPMRLKVGDTVTINTGAMGAYWVFGASGSVRVKRTR
jgi:hypothetical protein